MTSGSMVRLDFDQIMRDAFSVGLHSQRKLAEAAEIDRATLRKIRGEEVSESIARAIEAAINTCRQTRGLPPLDWKDWRTENPDAEVNAGEAKNIRGIWHVLARDLESPPDFDYSRGGGPRQLEMTLEILQENEKVWARGVDQDGDPVKAWDASFCRFWRYISGRHLIQNDRVSLHGVFFLEYLNRGDRLRGYYLQTETDHQSGIVLGKLEFTLLERHAR